MPVTDDAPTIAAPRKRAVRRRLKGWFAAHARDLPWRENRDPYRVWLSEIMLQQTQVETVKPYFARFLAAFPTVHDLAAAPEQQVLRLWEGLGYYRRARGLHAAAKVLVSEHNGQFPRDLAALQNLPGVGRYTAGAIASIAFDLPAPILEANTIRLFTRLTAYRGDPTSTPGQKYLWRVAEALVPPEGASQFNQAVMELGALVCTPKAPKCDACPLAKQCEANLQDAVELLQPTTKKLKFVDVNEAAVVVYKGEQVLVRQCGPGERWSGLWDFPRFAVESEGPLFAQDELTKKVAEQTGVEVRGASHLKTLKHGVTKHRITLDCYTAKRTAGRLKSTADSPTRWIDPAELGELPLSVTGRKIAKLIG
ncbi:A/G-specific adenine glycosylase [Posidoniimonas polymericola]|uniref:Adenine DNA glycosylase n=1 Tax=Posidoniimonas polymericola TaxID=2528002 RepID=A0A5C5ZFS8_9BACT|nr:A/G-specific adenine glycosylase [Posidoniimonas polymericola]TWT85423.1 A/G-specific adenine glycosylase [Posidoniimonas polymericola]